MGGASRVWFLTRRGCQVRWPQTESAVYILGGSIPLGAQYPKILISQAYSVILIPEQCKPLQNKSIDSRNPGWLCPYYPLLPTCVCLPDSTCLASIHTHYSLMNLVTNKGIFVSVGAKSRLPTRGAVVTCRLSRTCRHPRHKRFRNKLDTPSIQ